MDMKAAVMTIAIVAISSIILRVLIIQVPALGKYA